MKKAVLKKGLSLFLSVVMVLTLIPTAVKTFASTEYPLMESYNAASSGDYHRYYANVYTVTFLDSIDYDDINSDATVGYWDVSENDDSSVMAWMKLNNEATAEATAAAGLSQATSTTNRYDVYIAGEGGVEANPNSAYIFYCFSNLKEVRGTDNLKTDNVTTFYKMFEKCSSLEVLDLSTWNTSNVENMAYVFCDCSALSDIDLSNWNTENITNMNSMFRNCISLKELDLSSFDTANVTDMTYLFYKCENLVTVYVSDKWSIESVEKGTGVFNCCYAISGKTEFNQAYMDHTYATTEYYLTPVSEKPAPEVEKYKVTYVFYGDIPQGIEVYPVTEAEKGTVITVNAEPFVDGYEFSGWTSSDADISGGSFVIENDVTIIGSWEKLYNVYYEYIGYVPDGAPSLNTYTFKAGDNVTVDAEPFVDNYTFTGWKSDDITAANGSFEMPNADVTIYGSFSQNVYTITYIINEAIYKTENSVSDKNIELPKVTLNKNEKFSGWNSDDVDITENGFIMPRKNVTVYGTITEVPYNITYIWAEDSYIPSDIVLPTDTEFSGNEYTLMAVEDTNEYDFCGWTVIDSDGNTVTVTDNKLTMPESDITVIGKCVRKYTMTGSALNITVGVTENINISVIPEPENKEIEYISEDPLIAVVDNNGNVTAVNEGTTVIICTLKEDGTKLAVTVNVSLPEYELTVNGKDSFYTGEKIKLAHSVTPDIIVPLIYEIKWESSNDAIASVDDNGEVTAIAPGDAVITATLTVNGKEVSRKYFDISVKNYKITSEDIEIYIGESKDIIYEIIPSADKTVVWTPEDNSVISIENGSIIGLKEGTSTVKGVIEELDIHTEFTVTVKNYNVTVNGKNEMFIDEEQTLDITIEGNLPDGFDKTVILETANNEIIEIDSDAGVIKALKPGTATVTATLPATGATAIFTVTVKEPEYSLTAPDSVTVKLGETANLGVAVTPNFNAPEITYSSSDESVVSVDKDGNITGIAQGTAFITADIGNGDVKIITVTVTGKIITKHHIAFGKTDGIGWYKVSRDGGETFELVFGNSTIEVEEGTILLITTGDIMGESFTFYVNGDAVKPDENGFISVEVNGYMLIGALSMEVEVPDIEESLNLLERIIKAIRDFFTAISALFDNVFNS